MPGLAAVEQNKRVTDVPAATSGPTSQLFPPLAQSNQPIGASAGGVATGGQVDWGYLKADVVQARGG